MAFDGLISRTIGSVINGISQQPAPIRLKSQGEEQINCLSDVVDGVSRRPPTKHVIGPNTGTWPSAVPTGGLKVFPINRGSGEQFIGILEDKDINVFNLAGTEMTVTDLAAGTPTNYTYLDFDTATYTAEEAFATVTIADYTFIVNKTKTVAMSGNSGASSTVTRSQDHEFMMWAGAPPDDTTFNLTIGGTATAAATGATLDSSGALDTLMTNLTGAGSGTDVTGTLAGFTNWKFTHPDNANWLYGYQFQNARPATTPRSSSSPTSPPRPRTASSSRCPAPTATAPTTSTWSTTTPRRSGARRRSPASTTSSTWTPCRTPSSTRAAPRSPSGLEPGPTARRATP
jgi:hypothetical protein